MKINLTAVKKADGSCDVFADVFSKERGSLYLTAERLKFRQTKPYSVDEQSVLNLPLEDLKEFAKQVLEL